MELTKEYFDKKFTDLSKHIEDQTDELARIIAETVANPMEERFANLEKKLDVEKDVTALKVDMVKIKEALHIQ